MKQAKARLQLEGGLFVGAALEILSGVAALVAAAFAASAVACARIGCVESVPAIGAPFILAPL